jgi:flagellar biosynthesis protein FlhG
MLMEKTNHSSKIWAVAAGKGGTGKTFISTSIALTLTKLGYTVVVVDLDPTGANVHTVLGQNPSPFSIRNWLEDKRPLQELISPTGLPRLSFVQGLWDSWSSTTITHDDAKMLLPQLRSLKFDYVILDLGPGAAESQLEFFRGADEKILLTTPEPTSIEKTYRFMESYICSSLSQESTAPAYDQLIKVLREHRSKKIKKYFSFRSYLKNNDGFVFDHFEKISQNPVRLLVNCSRSQQQNGLGHSIRSVCHKYYDLSLDYSGALDYDNAVWQSVRNREHVLLAQPFTPLAAQFLAICKHLIAPEEHRAVG